MGESVTTSGVKTLRTGDPQGHPANEIRQQARAKCTWLRTDLTPNGLNCKLAVFCMWHLFPPVLRAFLPLRGGRPPGAFLAFLGPTLAAFGRVRPMALYPQARSQTSPAAMAGCAMGMG